VWFLYDLVEFLVEIRISTLMDLRMLLSAVTA
jgi:hypothetical protein